MESDGALDLKLVPFLLVIDGVRKEKERLTAAKLLHGPSFLLFMLVPQVNARPFFQTARWSS